MFTNNQHIVISPYIPFPNILWWAIIGNTNSVLFEENEHFQKMSYRNRYYIGGSNGLIQLSIPLTRGRNQRTPIRDVTISYDENWQLQHWRTLVSVYKRSPFFEYYEPGLQAIFEKHFKFLFDFNLTTIHWLKEQTSISFQEAQTASFQLLYDDSYIDLRQSFKPGIEKLPNNAGLTYYQVFADRTGFLPNLSLLDLLFSEGPQTKKWLSDNKASILKWGK